MPELYVGHPTYSYERDFRGYGEQGLCGLRWPNNAKIAVSFVFNYEEGGEHSVQNGDGRSEDILTEQPGRQSLINQRSYNVESEYEYGSRAGFWRLFRLFNKYDMKFTLYAVAQAVEKVPEVASRCVELGHDVASHAYRWIDHHPLSVEEEKELVRKAITSLKGLTGYAPKGWYYGRPSPQSRTLVPQVYEKLGETLVWASDTPYSYDCNDFKFHTPGSGFRDPDGFYSHLKNAFDTLYEEGDEGQPKMMTVGLHCRIIGRPGRFKALKDFVDYISQKEGVWVATRTEIAESFASQYPYEQGYLAKAKEEV